MSDHKLVQLCAQVEEAIACALGASADSALRELLVVDVVPLRGASLLSVSVCPASTDEVAYDFLQHKLDRARGYLRGEVARSIHRKRVPTIDIVLVPPDLFDDEEADDG